MGRGRRRVRDPGAVHHRSSVEQRPPPHRRARRTRTASQGGSSHRDHPRQDPGVLRRPRRRFYRLRRGGSDRHDHPVLRRSEDPPRTSRALSQRHVLHYRRDSAEDAHVGPSVAAPPGGPRVLSVHGGRVPPGRDRRVSLSRVPSARGGEALRRGRIEGAGSRSRRMDRIRPVQDDRGRPEEDAGGAHGSPLRAVREAVGR
mmetsp:Transcript_33538/g.99937  ORF Transcript_33538/g.99937 Transcript_33538/m.99937 type:complete len:201 (-) Transcript_33538:993-1595(-)